MVVLCVGIGTYLTRVSAVALSDRLGSPSARTEAMLRLIAPAVLAGIVADRLFLAGGELSGKWEWWVAGVVAGAVSLRWRSVGLTMLAGMGAVWLLGAIA